MMLAVETSGAEGSIALSDGQDLIEERLLQTTGRRHAQTLVAEVDGLLKEHSLSPSDIECVAVSAGPGSFTGLRVGVVFAKTFAWINDARLVAVDTLQAIAQRVPAEFTASRVTVISDAQRGDVFVNDYEWDADAAIRQPAGSVRIEPLAAVVSCGTLVTGPGLTKFAAEFPSTALLANESLWQPRASAVAEIGRYLLQQSQFADPHTLEPLYIRRSYAEEKSAGG
ncbi:MAG: tRNA (adenosine(37)-N6)-threonylcarbamoyltransferase complex dimerization subunit type 1 TsaB [Planctomycetaceae bacterium]